MVLAVRLAQGGAPASRPERGIPLDSQKSRHQLNLMVKSHAETLDRTFAALADPTRRAMVMRLGETPDLSVSELARPFPMSLPAVMKHLDVLSDAGLVIRTKAGRTVHCRLAAQPMREAMDWLARYERFWTGQIDRLEAFLRDD